MYDHEALNSSSIRYGRKNTQPPPDNLNTTWRTSEKSHKQQIIPTQSARGRTIQLHTRARGVMPRMSQAAHDMQQEVIEVSITCKTVTRLC